MHNKTELFATGSFKTPTTWRKPSVLLASLAINLFALALPMVILQVYDRIIPNQAKETFTLLLAGMAVVVVLDTILKIFRSLILSWEGARFDHRESLKAMSRILDSETLAFEEKSTGYYLDKMHALEQIQEFHSGQSILLMLDFPFVVVFMVLIWVIAGPLIFIPVVLLLLFLVVSIITGRHLHEALVTRSTMEDHRQNFLIETLQGIHTIKSMAMESFMLRRYEKLQAQSAGSVFELSKINSVAQGIGATFSQLSAVSFVAIGSFHVIDGALTIGALAAGTMLSSRVLQPGLRAMGLWIQFQSIRLAHQKIKGLYELEQEKSGSFMSDNGISGKIELRDVAFKYPTQEQEVLSGISLTINPGDSISITGNNGVGKTTLINLLSGFLHPSQGQILLDDKDIKDFDLEYLRSQIGIVPQLGNLFEGTILENMTLYREGQIIDRALELSTRLGLEEIISRLPNGLDTQVGGAAVDTLSEGVRQKIIMVRSLAGHPPIVLFDDANANFDIKNDKKLQGVVEEMLGKYTIVIISHRPSFLRLCNRQFVLKDGKLTEAGTSHQASSNNDKPSKAHPS
jgi:ATP-binding cassette, subfamily C, bacterial LapB